MGFCGRAATRTTIPRARVGARSTAGAAIALALALAGIPTSAGAQCTVVQQPTKFDPAPPIIPADMFGRQDSMAIGTSGSSPRLIIRYSYGFVVYSLASPGMPSKVEVHSLKSQEGYPKSGDGLERTGPLGMSVDGARAVVPWGDVTAFGTVALTNTPNGFSGGGDFAPEGASVTATAVARVGSRYLGFSTIYNTVVSTLYAADLTNIPTGVTVTSDGPKLTIPSEPATNVSLGSDKVTTLRAVEGSSSWLLAASASQVTVIDVSGAGAGVPGLTAGFTAHSYSLSALGISSGQIQSMSAVAHPTDGSLHLLVEAAVRPGSNDSSTGVSLTRIDPATGSATVLGTYVPPAGANTSQVGSVLVPLGTDVAAVFLEGMTVGGMEFHVHAGTNFTHNLASGLTFSTFNYLTALAGFRSTNNSIYLYIGRRNEASYAATLSCATTPAPATATMTVERLLKSGAVEQIAPGGTVYVGDTLRLKPAYSPPDSVQPLLDWRLDYDVHAAESSATAPQLVNPDTSKTQAGALPAAQYSLIGPCDPGGTAGGGGDPTTGNGCWASVLANGDFTADLSAGSKKLLSVAFEATNALNLGGSALATQTVSWEVPAAVLKSTALLAGGTVEVDPKGWPADSGYKWYFASTSGSDVLTLKSTCTGAVCNPGLLQAGTYRYWASVPYRNGFATPDCPGLSGTTCSGDATKTVQVTDVVLGFTLPPTGLVGSGTIPVASSSIKAATATPCGGTSGFSYDLCTLSGGACVEGNYSNTGLALVGDPFSGGSLTIPNPGEGTFGVRLKYAYTTTGSCTTGLVEAKWPGADASPAWAPLTIVKPAPTIRLRNASNTADITFQPGFGYTMPSGSTARAYAYIDGAQDPNPPGGMQWTWTNTGGQSTTFGTAQGATLSSLPVNTYTIELAGYAISPAPVALDVSAPIGDPPIVTSVTFSRTAPAVGESITVSCQASQGTFPIGTYQISFGDSESYTGPSSSASHAWATEGTKSVACVAVDVNDHASTARSSLIDVGGPDVGPAVTAIDVTPEFPRPALQVTLTCSATAPAGRLVVGYEFDFGDSSSPASGPSNTASHVYQSAGTYPATCRAWDASGRSGFLPRDVVVYEPSYSIQAGRIGSGSGLVYSTPSGLNCGSVCSMDVGSGSSVRLDALPAVGSRFAGWSGSGCAGTGPCTVLMTAVRLVTASFLPESGTGFFPVSPCRLADTRTGSGIPLAAGEVRELPVVASGCGIPFGAEAAALNVTVTGPASQGFVTIFPAGAENPGTQTTTFSSGRTRAASAIVQLGSGGAVSAYNGSAGPVHVILDVSGVFR